MAKVFIETTTPCPECKVRGLVINDILTDCNEDDIRKGQKMKSRREKIDRIVKQLEEIKYDF